MSPEFGSTCAIFPVDAETLRYLELTGRPTETIELVDAYAREQGMFHEARSPEPVFSDALELDLGEVVSSIAGPNGPRTGAAGSGQGGLSRRDAASSTRRPPPSWVMGATARWKSPSPPPIPRPEDHDDERGKPRPATERRSLPRRSGGGASDAIEVTLGDGEHCRARPRPGRDRSDHQLHQHLESDVMIAAGLLARNALHAGSSASPG